MNWDRGIRDNGSGVLGWNDIARRNPDFLRTTSSKTPKNSSEMPPDSLLPLAAKSPSQKAKKTTSINN